MSIDRDVEGRIRQNHVGLLLFEQSLIVGWIPRIATKQAMGAKNPKIAGSGDNILRNPDGNVVIGTGLLRALFGSFVKNHVNLAERETGDFNVIELHVLKKLQLDRQCVAIPPRKLGELVVGNDICPPIGLSHIRQDHDRNRRKTQQFSCRQPAVSGNHLAIARNEDRICKAKALDGIRNLPDLPLRMGAGVAGVRANVLRGNILNRKFAHLKQSQFDANAVRDCLKCKP